MSGVRGFATKAKNFITYSFTHNGFKIVWRNRIHHSGEGDWAIKQALAKYSDTIQEKEYHEVQFRYVLSKDEYPTLDSTANQDLGAPIMTIRQTQNVTGPCTGW